MLSMTALVCAYTCNRSVFPRIRMELVLFQDNVSDQKCWEIFTMQGRGRTEVVGTFVGSQCGSKVCFFSSRAIFGQVSIWPSPTIFQLFFSSLAAFRLAMFWTHSYKGVCIGTPSNVLGPIFIRFINPANHYSFLFLSQNLCSLWYDASGTKNNYFSSPVQFYEIWAWKLREPASIFLVFPHIAAGLAIKKVRPTKRYVLLSFKNRRKRFTFWLL